MTDFRETPGTPEDVAARAADSMAFLSDVERKAREACNYEVSDAYQNAWLVIRDLQTALARVKELCDARPYLNSELLVAQVYRALGIDPYSKEPAASPAPPNASPATPPAEAREVVELTPTRVALLRSFPHHQSAMSADDLAEMRECIRLGWADEKMNGAFLITRAGKEVLAALSPASAKTAEDRDG